MQAAGDKLLTVIVDSDLYGEAVAIARDLSTTGVLVQTNDLLPLGSVVTVRFRMAGCEDEIAARAEVKRHTGIDCAGNDDEPRSVRGMDLCFVDFDADIPLTLPSQRVLH